MNQGEREFIKSLSSKLLGKRSRARTVSLLSGRSSPSTFAQENKLTLECDYFRVK
jgi:hypothetical protein